MTTDSTLGEVILALYQEYLTIYGDEDLAAVAAAATMNELLAEAADGGEGAAAA